jgi:hypothetical protein
VPIHQIGEAGFGESRSQTMLRIEPSSVASAVKAPKSSPIAMISRIRVSAVIARLPVMMP